MKIINAITALSALAQETRLEIFGLLVQVGAEGLPAGQIGERFGLPFPTLSFHLSHLKRSGLIDCRREGRSLIYSANYKNMNKLMTYLTENCCQENPAGCDLPAVCESK
ncbi:MAG: helix-turn-helix transcriptional regulator [Nitrospinae bacterium]|nr:helix-turn-helix transcriptional regulator [Nitrospinota bacterium]